jgi:hypothetical protein
MNTELAKVRRSITELEHKLADENLSDGVRALAVRALRLVQANEEKLLTKVLDTLERPEVLQ